MDAELFQVLNSWNGRSAIVDGITGAALNDISKSVPFMMVFWCLWFLPKTNLERTRIRTALTATLVLTVPIIGIARAMANYAPFSLRPIHTPGLDINLRAGQGTGVLDGWSSMPSDHASLFMGLAVAFFCIHRTAGLVCIFWAVAVVSIPRIVLGLHWPSDIIAGWVLGAVIAASLISPAIKMVERTHIVPYFERREAIGYPLLFLATFEVVQMFAASRGIVEKLIG